MKTGRIFPEIRPQRIGSLALVLCVVSMLAVGCDPKPVPQKSPAKPGGASQTKQPEGDAGHKSPEPGATKSASTGEAAPGETPAEKSSATGEEKPTGPAVKVSVDQAVDAALKAQEEAAKAFPVTECRWAIEPIKIDGQSDDKAWQAAPLIENFIIPWLKDDARRPPRTGTKAKVLWDDKYFYFTADMEDADLYADVDQQDGDLWNNDVFEVFFKPSAEKPDYYEFEINAKNAKLDMHLPRRNAGGFIRFKNTQTFHIDSAVKLRGTLNKWEDQDEGWTVEGRIPWSDFAPTGGAPKVDDQWTYALCRYDYSVAFEGPELSTTAPLQQVNFHRWEDYTPLRFVGPAKTSQLWPHGIEKRVELTTSKVLGSPEPPLPYRPVATYPNLTLRQPLSIYPEPGTDKLLLMAHSGWWNGPGSIVRISGDEQTSEVEPVLSLDYLPYGLTFHPKFLENGYIYVGMNGPVSAKTGKKTRVARYTIGREAPFKIDPASELMIIEWESDGHNGGDVGFGPDGMLYITSGDGTSDSDTNLTGQDVTNLNATMIRIDVDHPDTDRPYSVPQDNPFIGVKVEKGEARPEIWAFGFRNPWRMTFDKKTGHLWVGQNGQDLWEQVIFVRKGENYGWSVTEGGHPFYLERKQGPAPITKPLIDHPHSEARSLTGGVVYYGTKFPELVGAYIYGDWSTGKIWAVKYDGEKILFHQEIADTTLQIGGFGVDHQGELMVLDQGGGKKAGDSIYRLEPTPAEVKSAEFPRKLSETGLFTDVAKNQVQPALIPYSVNVPQWADGADSERFMALTGLGRMPLAAGGRGWNLPEGSVLLKTLSMELEQGNPASRKRIETQMLTKQQNEWSAYTYAWNDDQTDAVLVEKEGREQVLEIKDASAPNGLRKQVWTFANRTDCMGCHSRAANFLLGISEIQLNKSHNYGAVSDNQLRTFAHLGLFDFKWTDVEDTWFNQVSSYAQKPVTGAMWLLNLFEKKAPEPAKYVAAPETPPPAAPQPTGLQFPGDLTYFLPAPVEWTRREVLNYHGQFRAFLAENARQLSELPKPTTAYGKLTNPYDEHADLDARARSYLHANCSQCHVNAGGGNSAIELDFAIKSPDTKLFHTAPKHDKFGLTDAELIAPGDPDRSVLLYRVAKLGGGRMPKIGSGEVDVAATNMLRSWIEQMPPAGEVPAEIKQQRAAQQSAIKDLATPGKLSDADREQKVTELLSTTSGALALLAALDKGEFKSADREQVLALATASQQPTARDLFERFVPLDQRIKRLGPSIDQQRLLAMQGDIERGKELFFKVGSVNCKSCHRIGEGQEQLGPDLNEIGKKYTRAELLSHIIDPSKKVEQKYTAYAVLDAAGKVYTGVITQQSDAEVVLKNAENKEIKLKREDIEEMNPSTKSIMPDQLLRDMTAQQAVDLLEYLASLKPTEATASNAPKE